MTPICMLFPTSRLTQQILPRFQSRGVLSNGETSIGSSEVSNTLSLFREAHVQELASDSGNWHVQPTLQLPVGSWLVSHQIWLQPSVANGNQSPRAGKESASSSPMLSGTLCPTCPLMPFFL